MDKITPESIREMHPLDAPLETIADRVEELESALEETHSIINNLADVRESLFADVEKKQLEICDLERKLSVEEHHVKELSRHLFTDPHSLEIRMSIGNVRWMRSIWGGCIEQCINPERMIKQEAEAMFKKLWELHKGEGNV
jgi:predicted RNase H-like nuclease (RuvC/YqgF family)